MRRYNLNEAIDRLERSFITADIKISPGKVGEDKDLLRRIISDCLLIVALRLGYRTTVEVMLPNYWRCDYDGERAEGKTDQRQSNRRFPIRQTANCVNSNQQRPEHKAGPADPKEGKGSEKAPT